MAFLPTAGELTRALSFLRRHRALAVGLTTAAVGAALVYLITSSKDSKRNKGSKPDGDGEANRIASGKGGVSAGSAGSRNGDGGGSPPEVDKGGLLGNGSPGRRSRSVVWKDDVGGMLESVLGTPKFPTPVPAPGSSHAGMPVLALASSPAPAPAQPTVRLTYAAAAAHAAAASEQGTPPSTATAAAGSLLASRLSAGVFGGVKPPLPTSSTSPNVSPATAGAQTYFHSPPSDQTPPIKTSFASARLSGDRHSDSPLQALRSQGFSGLNASGVGVEDAVDALSTDCDIVITSGGVVSPDAGKEDDSSDWGHFLTPSQYSPEVQVPAAAPVAGRPGPRGHKHRKG